MGLGGDILLPLFTRKLWGWIRKELQGVHGSEMLLTSPTWGTVCGSEVQGSLLKVDYPLLQDGTQRHRIHPQD